MAWVAITALGLSLEEVIGRWPYALRTLVLTGLMVPFMQRAVPAVGRMIDRMGQRVVASVRNGDGSTRRGHEASRAPYLRCSACP